MSRITALRWLWVLLAAVCGLTMLSVPQQGRILDLRFWYTAQDALDYLASLQGETRSRYLIHEWLDFGFMGFYSLALAGFWKRHWRLQMLPWLPGFLDFVETSSIVAILCEPERFARLGLLISISTPVKYLFFYGVIISILFSAIFPGWMRRSKRS